MTFVTLFTVRVSTEEPKTGDNCATKKDEKHLQPLFVTLVELGHNNLAASHIDKGAARKTQECYINKLVAVGNAHSNEDTKGRHDGKDRQEKDNLLSVVACSCESSSE